MLQSFRCLALSCLLLFVTAGRAELVYQPPAGSEAEATWRSAGSLLLEGIARVFDSLAAIESKNTSLANKHLDEAVSRLRGSMANYEKVRAAIPRPRKIPLERLSAGQQQQIARTFDFYKVSLPQNEADAAALALSETQRFVSQLADLRPKIVAADLAAVQRVLVEITRLQRIGTQTAELMSSLR